jgi:hypothetical protein
MRRLVIAASSLLAVGCVPVGNPVAPPEPGEPAGPTLVFDVTNESDAELVLGFEFEADLWSGGGEALVSACRRETFPQSSIGGAYRVTVDGAQVAEGTVPAGAVDDAWFLFRVRIDPNGDAEAAPPVLVMEPPTASVAIADCG